MSGKKKSRRKKKKVTAKAKRHAAVRKAIPVAAKPKDKKREGAARPIGKRPTAPPTNVEELVKAPRRKPAGRPDADPREISFALAMGGETIHSAIKELDAAALSNPLLARKVLESMVGDAAVKALTEAASIHPSLWPGEK